MEEAPRAVPYAERGLELAEASEDPKLIRTALLAGSEIYYKAGNYAVALERAQRVLKNNPKDKDALSLYMQVKGRDAASVPSPAKGATGEMEQTSSATAQAAARGPGVAMTNIASLEARKQIATGWNLIKLDPKAAFGHFDAAVAADPRNAAARVERSKARLETGDAPGALEDAAGAAALEPRLGAAYAARAEARRALGRPHAELLADYETAANLDGRFAEAYKTLLLRGAEAAGKTAGAGAAAPGGLNGLFARSSKAWGPAALLAASAAALGVLIAPLLLKRRRPGEDGSLRR
ncbi:MAG: hypothetical protein HY403_12245 [Elusimicrobia bacterium]|nr:hypothetical protein [Elusimicrobiota bacterium]